MEYPQVGCVIMASGMARRFGSNKLVADFGGEAMICRILKATQGLFVKRVVVTRHEEVARLCQPGSLDKCHKAEGLERFFDKAEGPEESLDMRDVTVVLHDRPGRNDTVRLGMEALGQKVGELESKNQESKATDSKDQDSKDLESKDLESKEVRGQDLPLSHVIFCQSDQPLLSRDSIKRLVDAGLSEGRDLSKGQADCLEEKNDSLLDKRSKIYRLAFEDQVGAPVLFPAWTFGELMDLPEKKGGGFLIKKYSDWVEQVQADSPYELKDVDRPEDLAELLKLIKPV